jgi:nucleotide-binding universal stress UspA family protein
MSSPEVFVVGVDDSSNSRLALEYAANEAVLRGATLRVVSTFESAGQFGTRYGVPIPVTDQQIAERVLADTNAVVNEVVAGLPEPLQVQVVARAGSAGSILADESRTADMLFVGHHGRGALASAILGSVGLHCVLHARCSVTVVRPIAEQAAQHTTSTEIASTEDAVSAIS